METTRAAASSRRGGRRGDRGRPWLPLALSAFFLFGERAAAAGGGAIAYLAPSRSSQQIRIIDPDGSGARLLWSAPPGTLPGVGPDTLSWRPDGRALVFDSGHEALRSVLVRDLYVASLSGGPLLRLTSPPDPSAYASLPQGSAVLRVTNTGYQGRNLSAFIEGASEPVEWTAGANTERVVRFPRVAAFGRGIRQYARVTDGRGCWVDLAAFAEVKPGSTVDAGTLSGLNAIACPLVFAPSWRADGKSVAYLLQWPRAIGLSLINNDIWRIAADGRAGNQAEPLLARNQIGALTSGQEFYAVTMSPLPSAADLLLLRGSLSWSEILVAKEGDIIGSLRRIELAAPAFGVFRVTGIAWMPNAAGFYFSRYEESYGQVESVLYSYDFRSRRANPILRLVNEVIGRISASPDGRTIVFERAARLEDTPANVVLGPRALCPCDLWLVDITGGAPRLLVRDGRAPAWSPR